jgi:hypothetical protein
MRLSLPATFFINAFAVAFAKTRCRSSRSRLSNRRSRRTASSRCTNYPGARVVISLYTFALLLHEALGVLRFQVVGARLVT